MKIDEKLLEEGRKVAEERVNRANALTLNILKGLWAIEQAIGDVLAVWGASGKKGFSNRAKACEELDRELKSNQHWSVLWSAYSLRNEVAHSRDEEKINSKAARLRADYLMTLTPEQAKGLEGIKDDIVCYQACIAVAGFLWAECAVKKGT